MSPLLEVSSLTVRFGRLVALDDVSLRVDRGTVTGIIGPNGAGKTTLIDAISGYVPVASGTVRFDGSPLDGLRPHLRARQGLSRTFQALELFDGLTVAENLLVAAEGAGAARGDGSAEERSERVVSMLGIEALAARYPDELTTGDRKLVALARALAGGPKAVLLDEPAAGLDPAERGALGERLGRLAEEGVSVVVVDHDMDLVLNVCDRVWVLDFGRVIASGPPPAVRGDAGVVAAYLGAPGSARPGERRAPIPSGGSPPPMRARRLTAGYEGVAAVHDLDLEVAAGEVVALLGRNGAGKTTTLRALSGALEPMQGAVEVLGTVGGRPHRRVRAGLAYVPQDRGLCTELTVAENLRLAAHSRRPVLDDVLSDLPALGPLLDHRAGSLSGGEQQMLALARALVVRPRALLVDELSTGLAPEIVRRLLDTLATLAADAGTAVLLVEQHVALALSISDRAYVLERGRVVLQGPAEALAGRRDLLENSYLGPAHDATGEPG